LPALKIQANPARSRIFYFLYHLTYILIFQILNTSPMSFDIYLIARQL
jgi:hypothetical protein